MRLLVVELQAGAEIREDFSFIRSGEFVEERGVVVGVDLVEGSDIRGVIDIHSPGPEDRIGVEVGGQVSVGIHAIKLSRLDHSVGCSPDSILPIGTDSAPAHRVDKRGHAVPGLGAIAGQGELEHVLSLPGDVVDKADPWRVFGISGPRVELGNLQGRQQAGQERAGGNFLVLDKRCLVVVPESQVDGQPSEGHRVLDENPIPPVRLAQVDVPPDIDFPILSIGIAAIRTVVVALDIAFVIIVAGDGGFQVVDAELELVVAAQDIFHKIIPGEDEVEVCPLGPVVVHSPRHKINGIIGYCKGKSFGRL